jgi:hypothetical protein
LFLIQFEDRPLQVAEFETFSEQNDSAEKFYGPSTEVEAEMVQREKDELRKTPFCGITGNQ